ncbi:MAG: polysaccharide deacetylase family protein [Patescibacteria group bacterium]
MLTLTFDDCYLSQKNEAQELLRQAKLKASFYVITDYLEEGNYLDFMKKSDILSLLHDGHEIGSHTKSHPRLPLISSEKRIAELTDSKNKLKELGINAATFVYPYGNYSENIVEEVKKVGYTSARSTEFGFNTPKTNPYILKCQPVYRWVPFFIIKYWIDKAEKKNLWLILMFHQIDTTRGFYGTTPNTFEKIVTYITKKKIQTVTMSDGINKIMKPYVKILIKDNDKTLEHYFVRADEWGIPAGKIEGSELPVNAAVRELLERTGFSIESDKLTQVEDEGDFYVFKGDKKDLTKIAEPGEIGGYKTEIRWN